MDKKQIWNLGYWLIALIALLLLQNIWQTASQALPVPYSEFEKALSEGRIAKLGWQMQDYNPHGAVGNAQADTTKKSRR